MKLDHPKQKQLDLIRTLQSAHAVPTALFVELLQMKYESTKEKLVSAASDDILQVQAEAKSYKTLVTELTRTEIKPKE